MRGCALDLRTWGHGASWAPRSVGRGLPTPSGRVSGARSGPTRSGSGRGDRKLLGWLTQPAAGPGSVGVVLVPPLGYEYFTTHRTLRALAERLAAQGCSVVRFDLDGTGDSSGGPATPTGAAAWRASVHEAAAFLRPSAAGRWSSPACGSGPPSPSSRAPTSAPTGSSPGRRWCGAGPTCAS